MGPPCLPTTVASSTDNEVLNEPAPAERSRERLYVGLSRARDQLVVCGDPAYVLEVGGSAVLRRLRR
jgi:ATP-dependent exoDNAse (exonuclease V) beta subunit